MVNMGHRRYHLLTGRDSESLPPDLAAQGQSAWEALLACIKVAIELGWCRCNEENRMNRL